MLILLESGPKHGYQLMQEIADRTDGAWRPSPGAIYPTISMLEDEGYVELTRDGSRQLATLTESGRSHLEENRESIGDPFAARLDSNRPEMRDVVEGVIGAMRQIIRTGSNAQLEAARTVLTNTRRSLYLILAEEPAADETAPAAPPASE